MNNNKILSLILFAVMMLSMMVSCGGDDDNSDISDMSNMSVKNQLVGVWETSMSSLNWKYILINSDGTLYYSVSVDKKKGIAYYSAGARAHWAFNEQTQTISMYTDDGYYRSTYSVNMAADGNRWMGISPKGNQDTFVRLNVSIREKTSY